MIYLSQLLGNPVLDANGEHIGVVNDLGIATGEVFPRVTSLAFRGPGKTPFMISWRKYVESFDENEVRLSVAGTDIRFSYLQPEEVLVARDLLNKQIVDTRGLRVVRVNDLKLSDSGASQLRLLGAEVGARGILRSLSPAIESLALKVAHTFGRPLPERIIAWNYMDLLDRDLSNVKLSVSHKTLDELHPADVADILEQLDPRLRAQVFAQLDDEQAAEAMAELDDDEMAARIMDDMSEADASKMLSEMDPDDAAELVGELDYEKAEQLLRLMGVQEERAIRQLLGYRDDTAGRIMTSEFLIVPASYTTSEAVEAVRGLDEDFETLHYVYLSDEDGALEGVVTLHQLLIAAPDTVLSDVAVTELVTASPEDDQEDVAQDIAKYNLLAMPVVSDDGRMLGIVTVDDALDVMEEEHEEDLQIAGGSHGSSSSHEGSHDLRQLLIHQMWFFFWVFGALVLGVVLGPLPGVLAAVAMPVGLLTADGMARYVINFALEYDADDDDAPSVVGFGFKGVGIGLFFTFVFMAVVLLVANALGEIPADPSYATVAADVIRGFKVSAVAGMVAFLTAPIYLVVLRRRDAANKDTSGVAVHAIAIAVTAIIYVAIAALV